jgi:hypothetical protein
VAPGEVGSFPLAKFGVDVAWSEIEARTALN